MILPHEYPEDPQQFGRRVAREAFKKHVLQISGQSSADAE